MAELVSNDIIVDAVLAFTILELAALVLIRRFRRIGPAPAVFLPTLLSGLALMLALRAVLAGAGPIVLALCLLASLLAHIVDLARLFRPQR